MDKKLSKDLECKLKEVVDHFDKEDRFVRERQIRLWKKLKFFWNGFQNIWWSDVAHDWRVWGINGADSEGVDDQADYYNKPINIFRAYLESIIAALSVSIPVIKAYPDDADNPLDLLTAKASDKIGELISKHNDVILLWLHALFIYCTEGMVACYTYPKEDESYGTYQEDKYEDNEISAIQRSCPTCGSVIDTIAANQLADQEKDEYEPDDDDAELHDILVNKQQVICPQCMAEIDPELQETKLIVPRLVGTTTKAKTRICMEVYGGLYVKVPNYAMNQACCPYLIFSYETNYVDAIERFPDLKNRLDNNSRLGPNSGGVYDPYERWGRLSTQYFGEYPLNTVTVRNAWLRPSAFNILSDEREIEQLKKKFPDGAKVILINDEIAEYENESLDDCWTLTQNPLSDYVHFDPLGTLLTSVQEITNDMISLILQTIEHGIPQTIADPQVLNFAQYREQEIAPGSIIPGKRPPGQNMGDAFLTLKTATLSPEVPPFVDKIQQAGQVVSGAMPSLYGGSEAGSSKTASEYSMSRAQAMQRLQISWTMFKIWWKKIYGKAIPAYIKEMATDEKFVTKDESGNFVNVFIRKAELEGKIGSFEIEAAEQLPSSWAQRRDVIMNLMQMSNPEVMAALTSPENIPLISEAIGITDFVIPGEDDRQKQYEEIKLLLMSQPIPNPQLGGLGPSIEIEPLVDNHEIEADICRRFLVSDAGRLAKTENPAGYQNVLLHMQQHVNMTRVQTVAPPMSPQPKQSQTPNTPRPTNATPGTNVVQ